MPSYVTGAREFPYILDGKFWGPEICLKSFLAHPSEVLAISFSSSGMSIAVQASDSDEDEPAKTAPAKVEAAKATPTSEKACR